MRNYQDCEAFFAKARRPEKGRPISGNVRMYKRGDAYAVQLFATDIVTYHPNGRIVFNTNGWRTNTTTRWIRSCSPASIYSHRQVTFFYYKGRSWYYQDGATIEPDDSVTGVSLLAADFWKQFKEEKARRRARRKQIRAWAKEYTRRMFSDGLARPRRKKPYTPPELAKLVDDGKYPSFVLLEIAQSKIYALYLDGIRTDQNKTYRKVILALYGVGELNYLNYIPALRNKLKRVIEDTLYERQIQATDGKQTLGLSKHFDDICYGVFV